MAAARRKAAADGKRIAVRAAVAGAPPPAPQRLIVAITGATGVIYGVRLLEKLQATDIETHLVVTPSAEMTLAYETDKNIAAGIEHFHNQFHIQLINVHDLKHEIRRHVIEAERHPDFGHRIPHHHLKDKLDLLIADLDKLEKDFHNFINK